MIENDIQRGITLEWIRRFNRAIQEYMPPPGLHLDIAKAELAALVSQRDDLADELAAYDEKQKKI